MKSLKKKIEKEESKHDTLLTIIKLNDVLSLLKDATIKAKTSLKFAILLTNIENGVKFYNESQNKIIKRLGKLTTTPEGDSYVIDEKDKVMTSLYLKELQELQELEFPFDKIVLNDEDLKTLEALHLPYGFYSVVNMFYASEILSALTFDETKSINFYDIEKAETLFMEINKSKYSSVISRKFSAIEIEIRELKKTFLAKAQSLFDEYTSKSELKLKRVPEELLEEYNEKLKTLLEKKTSAKLPVLTYDDFNDSQPQLMLIFKNLSFCFDK